MADTVRLNVTLDATQAARLSAMAKRAHMQDGTLARSLLSRAIDLAEPDGEAITQMLNGIDGALESALEGRRQAAAGEAIPLEDIEEWR